MSKSRKKQVFCVFLCALFGAVLPLLSFADPDCSSAFTDILYRGPNLPLTSPERVGSGSTKPYWYYDSSAIRWLVKKDVVHPELQTGAEVVSASIYRDLGYRAPSAHIVDIKGRRVAIEELDPSFRLSEDLAEINTAELRQLRVFAAFLKDWDRLRSQNNFLVGKQDFAIFDFGGALGARAKGEHKPGKSFSSAIGVFESDLSGKDIYEGFRVDGLPASHAWNQLTREDALGAAAKLRLLTDEKLERAVARAQYSRPEDAAYLVGALKARRDVLAGYLEKELGPGLRPTSPKRAGVATPQKMAAWRKQAAELVKESGQRFQQLFAQTSGFSDVQAFEETIRNGPELGRKILERLEKRVEVAIYRRSARRDSIARDGLLNQHNTGTSGGQVGEQLRNHAEADLLGVPYKEYKGLPPHVKPKSGLFQPVPGEDISRPANLMYGDDAYILRTESVDDRLTWTPEDSLNRYIVGNGIETEKTNKEFPAKAWDHMVIPWEHRSLATPYLLVDESMWGKFGTSGDPYLFHSFQSDAPHILKMKSETPSEVLSVDKGWGSNSQDYVEAQVWGPVDLDDVAAFQFTAHPPEGDFLEELLKRNIEIRDARDPNPTVDQYGHLKSFTSDPIKIWKPGMP